MPFAVWFNDQTKVVEYDKRVFRLVEDQELVATQKITTSAEAQARLEELIDDVKPTYREDAEHLHYLIKTAFRYPPLKYGSRFGKLTQPSYFYGSEEIYGALAETAYYRFLLSDGHLEVAYDEVVQSSHLVFSIQARTNKCLDLASGSFEPIWEDISDPESYHYSQKIGSWILNEMSATKAYQVKFEVDDLNIPIKDDRKASMIRFKGARAPIGSDGYINVAIQDPKIIKSLEPFDRIRINCKLSKDQVDFSSAESGIYYTFYKKDLLVGGQIPVIG